MRVVVVPPDVGWTSAFERAAREVAPAFGATLIALHHIGSTSIAGIYAKPIIDMLAEVADVAAVDQCNERLAKLGYVAKGEFGIAGRRYFYRNHATGERSHQVHAFQTGSLGTIRHLAFRDYLRAHPQLAQEYSELKRRLADAHPLDIEAYMDGKDGFIREVETRAMAWAQT